MAAHGTRCHRREDVVTGELWIIFGSWLAVNAAVLLFCGLVGLRRWRAERRTWLPNVEPPDDEGVQ